MQHPPNLLLGPTNTGKTWAALERLLAHESGMIGFPLRLLARENYDRVAARAGHEAVALVTGEERIVPRQPRYWICTVEAMPLERRVDFLAIDEIQLAADRERGHVFTDRILRARGRRETLLIGAATMRPLLRKLLPAAPVDSQERLSRLTYAGPKKLRHLPKRTAVVAFSVPELYEIAEALRERVGGAALVFGGLSPRTRNAQVGLYQRGEVDYLVATDAIGMGLNLDIDHVAFTRLDKFDGSSRRNLTSAEIAQIAGRAGRHTEDGTFGSTDALGELPRSLVSSVEAHRFDPIRSAFWRNPDLDFSSPHALLASLERVPPRPELVRSREADDHKALAAFLRDTRILALVHDRSLLELAWEVCQIPDFQGTATESHTDLLTKVFLSLSSPARRLNEDWVRTSVESLDQPQGDIDTLLVRIASVRTWTFISHRSAWLSDAAHWQARARTVEDRLSDALHERLTQQFVLRRASVVSLDSVDGLVGSVSASGEVAVQGLRAGQIEGFVFVPDESVRDGSRGILAAANRVLREGLRERLTAFEQAPDGAFGLLATGQLTWDGVPVARLAMGDSPLAPVVAPLPSDLLDAAHRERVRRRLADWLGVHLRFCLRPLFELADRAPAGAVRGLAFVLGVGLGSVPRARVDGLLREMSATERDDLKALGVTVGRASVFLQSLLRSDLIRLRATLYLVASGTAFPVDAPAPDGRSCVPLDPRVPVAFYEACGYQPIAAVAVRVDRLHRLAGLAAHRTRSGPLAAGPDLAAAAGVDLANLPSVLAHLGYETRSEGTFVWPSRRRAAGPRRR